MLTLTLQSVSALLKLGFVAVAFSLRRYVSNDRGLYVTSWRWLTAAFLVSGLSGGIQASWAVAAVRAGVGSATYELYIAAMPGLNYSRFMVAISLGIALSVLPFMPERASRARFGSLVAGALAAAAVGVLCGQAERFDPALHATRVAVLQFFETAVLLTALLVAVLRSSMDTWLWLTLFVYTFRQALNTVVWAAAALGYAPGAWHPPFWAAPLLGVVMWSLMIALGWRRLLLARRGAVVSAIFRHGDPSSGNGISSLRV